MTITLRRYAVGPWFTIGTGQPMLLAVGADPSASETLHQAVAELHEEAPAGIVYSDLSAGGEVGAPSPRRSTSVLDARRPAAVFTGSSDNPDDFGHVLAPILLDVRRFGMIAAPTDPVHLHFAARMPSGATTPVISWSASDPDRWTKAHVIEGRSFHAPDLRTGREGPSFAALAPHADVVADWTDLALHSTLRGRRALNELLQCTRSGAVPTAEKVAEVLRGLADVDAALAILLAPAAAGT